MAVPEIAGTGGNGLDHLLARERRGDRHDSGAEALGDGDDVGSDALLLQRIEAAGPPDTAHHLVGDEQHTVAIADVADTLEIARCRWHAAECRPADRLTDEGGDRLRIQALDFLL